MRSIDDLLRRSDWFLRRRDLLRLGYTDRMIRSALEARHIFRVRQGWYSVPDAPQPAICAVRVGGRLTSISALESYGLPVPRRPSRHVAVPATASRLRTADDRRERLGRRSEVRVHWIDDAERKGSIWRVSLMDALLAVLVEEPRDIAVACASAILHQRKLTAAQLDSVFARAPDIARQWRSLVSALDEAHGETFFRLGFLDDGIPFRQQVKVPGAGRLDFQVSEHGYVEVDGGQHDPGWTDPASGSWEKDHDWDTTIAIDGGTVLHYTYRQMYTDWPRVRAAIRRTIADDVALTKFRAQHPQVAVERPIRARDVPSLSGTRSHYQRKRRRYATAA